MCPFSVQNFGNYSSPQEAYLELLKEFYKNPWPDIDEFNEISKTVELDEKFIRKWFQKKRYELGLPI